MKYNQGNLYVLLANITINTVKEQNAKMLLKQAPIKPNRLIKKYKVVRLTVITVAFT